MSQTAAFVAFSVRLRHWPYVTHSRNIPVWADCVRCEHIPTGQGPLLCAQLDAYVIRKRPIAQSQAAGAFPNHKRWVHCPWYHSRQRRRSGEQSCRRRPKMLVRQGYPEPRKMSPSSPHVCYRSHNRAHTDRAFSSSYPQTLVHHRCLRARAPTMHSRSPFGRHSAADRPHNANPTQGPTQPPAHRAIAPAHGLGSCRRASRQTSGLHIDACLPLSNATRVSR